VVYTGCPFRDKRVVVTGGCEFIGSHLVEALWRDNHVVVVDNPTSGTESNLNEFDVDFIRCDIVGGLDDVFAGADVVFHTAAEVQVASSVQDPEKDASTNILGTISVLNAARRAGVGRIVYSSSAAVYGVPESLPISETHLTKPVSPYGLSKLTGERYLLMYHRLEKLPVVCLRYFNVFGSSQRVDSPYSGVLSIFARNLVEGLPSVVHGDGEQIRDFVHVSDVVQANLMVASVPVEKAVGRVFNVGTGYATSLNHLIEVLGLPKESVCYGPRRTGDIRDSVADVNLIREATGFQAQTSLGRGLDDYVTWLTKDVDQPWEAPASATPAE
jgi:UDP-glucose 4-epimerase